MALAQAKAEATKARARYDASQSKLIAESRSRQKMTVTIGAARDAKTEELFASTFTTADVIATAWDIAARETDVQVAKFQNPPERILIDNSPYKPLPAMRKNIFVVYQGGFNARPVMDQLLKAVKKHFPATSFRFIRRGGADRVVPRFGPVFLSDPREVLYLIPTGGEDPTKRNLDMTTPGRRGLVAKATAAARRNRTSAGFRVRSIQSFKHTNVRTGFRDGTPISVGKSGKRLSRRGTGKVVFYQGSFAWSIRQAVGTRRERS